MRSDANAHSRQISLFDVIPQEQEVISLSESVLFAKTEGKKIVYYLDEECTETWTQVEDSVLVRKILEQIPVYFAMKDGAYTWDRLEWKDG